MSKFEAADKFLETLDRRGTFEYTTGNDEFDETIARKWHAARPKEEKFIEKYGKDKIQKDLDQIKQIENLSNYKKERSPVSTLAEFVIAEGIGNRGWLGVDTSASITSKYDDILRGADLLVTIPNPLDPEGDDILFVVDMTSSGDEAVLEKKIRSELERLESGRRTRLKYFRGAEKPLNRYILGIPPDQVQELAKIVLGHAAKNDTEEMVRLELLDELRHQAAQQIDFLLRLHNFSGYRATDDPLEIRTFIKERADDLSESPEIDLTEAILIGYAILLHADLEEENLFAEMGDKKRAEAKRLGSLLQPVRYLQSVDFDHLSALQSS